MKNSSENPPECYETGRFTWETGSPLIFPAERPEDPCISIKDPSIVRHDGRWHIFASIRSEKRSHQIEYLSFESWDRANDADRHVLSVTDGYFCAPQIFYFEPHDRWILLYQVVDQSRKPALQPAFSTSTDVADPASWSSPVLLFQESGAVEKWIDFWIICDEQRAHLFFTSLDGKMWRSETALERFPHGWSLPVIVLEADVYEAGHTYRLRGMDRYITVIEAVHEGRRYFKTYTASSLSDRWEPLADSVDRPFAGRTNVRQTAEWTTSFSHGEVLRCGIDQRLEIDPRNLQVLYQGVSDEEREEKAYGRIPWKLALLKQLP